MCIRDRSEAKLHAYKNREVGEQYVAHFHNKARKVGFPSWWKNSSKLAAVRTKKVLQERKEYRSWKQSQLVEEPLPLVISLEQIRSKTAEVRGKAGREKKQAELVEEPLPLVIPLEQIRSKAAEIMGEAGREKKQAKQDAIYDPLVSEAARLWEKGDSRNHSKMAKDLYQQFVESLAVNKKDVYKRQVKEVI